MKDAIIRTFIYNSPKLGPTDGTVLDYRPGSNKNVTFKIPKFIEALGHIPSRYLDLLELASYVFCADRYIKRGNPGSALFSGWQRHFRHILFVRDYQFWSDSEVIETLEKLLSFMSGDIHKFEFRAGHSTPKRTMFDEENFWPPLENKPKIIMFSGGLDSTCGVYDTLVNTKDNIILASHASQTSSKKTQRLIVDYLNQKFNSRIHHLTFECHLSGARANEETQRTRSFLYSAVGAAIAKSYGQNTIYFYENGVLSINLPPSEQFQDARATRTTHPKVLYYLSRLLTLIEGNKFEIKNPFFEKTKTDITLLLKDNNGMELLNNTVSCSRTFDKGVKHDMTHCGRCSQCIDRRFGIAAAGLLEEENKGLYAYDLVVDNICPDDDDGYGREERTMLVDYVRLGMNLHNMNPDTFQDKWLDQLTDVIDYIEGDSDIDKIERLNKLFVRHGKQVMAGIHAFQGAYADQMLVKKHKSNSLAEILSKQEYLDTPPRLVANRIIEITSKALPIAFQSRTPANEHEVQNQIEALLKTHTDKLQREFPHVPFGLSKTVPDASIKNPFVLIEVKYPRGKISPSKVDAEIALDFTKYPDGAFLLFLIYDPERKIKNDKEFSKDFLTKRECAFAFIR